MLIGAAFAVLAGCGGAESEEAAAGGGAFQRPPTPVETALVSRGELIDRFEAVGTIEAAEAITVVSEIPGTVARLPFEEGSQVKRGALLAQLEDSELQASLVRAEALHRQRQANFDRIQVVVDKGAGTPQDLDNARAELAIAAADIDLARARLAKTRIVAPFPGRVGSRRISPGAFVQAGARITELARIDQLKIVFAAPERFVPKLARGEEVQITTTAFPGEMLAGTIHVIEPALDPATRNARIIAIADNPGERFRPGMSANVSAVLTRRANALTIPSEAIFADGAQMLVYVVQADSTVARTPITLGARLAKEVEVLTGLEDGQQVIRAGHQKLFPGAKVMPVTSADANPGADAGESS